MCKWLHEMTCENTPCKEVTQVEDVMAQISQVWGSPVPWDAWPPALRAKLQPHPGRWCLASCSLSKWVGGGADFAAGSCLHFDLLGKLVSSVRWVSRPLLRTGMGEGMSKSLLCWPGFTSTWLVFVFSYVSSTFMLLKLNSCSWSPEKQVTEKRKKKKKKQKNTHAHYSPPPQKKKKRQKN